MSVKCLLRVIDFNSLPVSSFFFFLLLHASNLFVSSLPFSFIQFSSFFVFLILRSLFKESLPTF